MKKIENCENSDGKWYIRVCDWHRYHERNKEKCLKKVDSMINNTKRDYKKWLVIDNKDYLNKKKKMNKDNMLEIDMVICLKKKRQNKRI